MRIHFCRVIFILIAMGIPRLKISLFVLILALSSGVLSAANEEFSFALPEFEGRISLGIFDATGKLVRSLFVEAEEEDFQKGLNGLIAEWDGHNEAGQPVTAGVYAVRGFLVGTAVQTEGVAYHFNDWIESDTSPRVSKIEAVVPTEGDSFLLCGQGFAARGLAFDHRFVWRFEESAGLQTLLDLPPETRFLTGDEKRIATWEKGPAIYDLKKPEHPVRGNSSPADLLGGVFWRKQLCLGFGTETTGRIEEWDATTLAGGKILAGSEALGGLAMLDANEAALIVKTTGGELWVSRGAEFGKMPLQDLPNDFSMAAGAGETLWVVGRREGKILVRQYGFEGELLREMSLAGAEVASVRIFADHKDRSFFLLLDASNGGGQSLRGYRSLAGDPPPASNEETVSVDWEVFLDKSIIPCSRFGWVDGHLVADAGKTPPPDRVQVTLPPDTLNAKTSKLELAVASDAAGLWLQSGDGLNLLRLAEGPGWKREMLVREGEALRVLAGDDVVVAEYRISGWKQIAPIDAGKIEIP